MHSLRAYLYYSVLCFLCLPCAMVASVGAAVSLPAGVRLEQGPGGLERLAIAAAEGEALIYLHGAHVAHFQPKGQRPVIWMSKNSTYATGKPGKAMRGGVPIIFPWFADNVPTKGAPMHGIARIFPWTLAACSALPDGKIRAVLTLRADERTRTLCAHDFSLTYTVTVGATLELSLEVSNTGKQAFTYEEALHTYFAVGDVRQVAIAGFEGAPYIDKVDAFKRKPGEPSSFLLTAETDRVYSSHTATVTLTDPTWQRRIVVRKAGSQSTVLWNPWIAKGAALADLAGEQWPFMLCVETANVGHDARQLAPGKSHRLTQMISLEPLR